MLASRGATGGLAAQTTDQPNGTIRLASQSPWAGPERPFILRLQVAGMPRPEEADVSVAVYAADVVALAVRSHARRQGPWQRADHHERDDGPALADRRRRRLDRAARAPRPPTHPNRRLPVSSPSRRAGGGPSSTVRHPPRLGRRPRHNETPRARGRCRVAGARSACAAGRTAPRRRATCRRSPSWPTCSPTVACR